MRPKPAARSRPRATGCAVPARFARIVPAGHGQRHLYSSAARHETQR
ncbi:uncharacterized protein BCN122_I2004 [Burkholderia cenocepacia]|nr:uncharacterized protein BCN122_I2004 [Burkholderia cenocepacia]